MQIGALRKLSLKDYPKVMSCVVFLVGCNYRCPFCDALEFVLPGVSKPKESVSEKDFGARRDCSHENSLFFAVALGRFFYLIQTI